MASQGEELRAVDKIVVTLDVCSSSAVMEDLLRSNNIEIWSNLLIRLENYLRQRQRDLNFDLYKFTGDGWIMLFDSQDSGEVIVDLLSELSKYFDEEYQNEIYGSLYNPPDIDGLTFGIDAGPLVKIKLHNRTDYIGRPINVACRLQGIINAFDIMSGYRAFISHYVYYKMKSDLKKFSPKQQFRILRNLGGGQRSSFWMLSISEDYFRVLKAIYGTKTHPVDVTKEVINLIKDNKLDFIIENDILGGDPHPGKKKQLTIEYIFDGKRLTKTYSENARLQLP